MKVVYLRDSFRPAGEWEDSTLGQYFALEGAEKRVFQDMGKYVSINKGSTIALLVDDEREGPEKVLAGAHIVVDPEHYFPIHKKMEEMYDDKRLARALKYKKKHAYVTGVVGANNELMLSPALYLQERLFEDFKAHREPFQNVALLTGEVLPSNAASVMEAANSANVKMAALESNPGADDNSPMFMVGARSEEGLKEALPKGKEQTFFRQDSEELRDLAHDALLKFKASRPKNRAGREADAVREAPQNRSL